MRKHVAMTIGPVVDTLSIAGSPGTLWCASTMFSRFAGDLCESILDEIPGASIDSPAYDKGFVNTDGIGRFHDRIFFTCEMEREELAGRLNTLCDNAKSALAMHISDALGQKDNASRDETKRYIASYIQLGWLIADSDTEEAESKDTAQTKDGETVKTIKENCILRLSQYLDCIDLSAQRLPDETESPIVKLLSGTSDGSNVYIYRHRDGKTSACWLIPEHPTHGAFQLLKGNAVRDIRDIADPLSVKDGRKIHSYFAVVQSDGDNMGTFLQSCPQEKIRVFSQCCIEYAKEAADLVGAFGGLTIYAGGDDLLFLAPLEGRDGTNLLDLCKKISEKFSERFDVLGEELGGVKTPTLSFGISINYEKSPLYEALEDARNLLFRYAKTEDANKEKNKIALSMHKHSGQSVLLLLPNLNADETPIAKIRSLIEKGAKKKTESADNALHSIIYQLEVFRSSFIESRTGGWNVQNLYDNLFDAAAHDMGREYINDIKKLGDIIAQYPMCRADDGKTSLTNNPVDVLTSILRFVKLFTERGNEN